MWRGLLWLGVILAAFGTQHVALRSLQADGPAAAMRLLLFALSACALVAAALHFRRFVGAWLVALGVAMNFAPMAANDALMPTSYELVASSGGFPDITTEDVGRQLGRHTVRYRDDINLYFLADRFYFDVPALGPNIYSLGDFVEGAGLLLVLMQAGAMALRPPRPSSASDRPAPHAGLGAGR